jgi:two-component system, sensor histidine kinase RegB
MYSQNSSSYPFYARHLRLMTLMRLRWLAITGQALTVWIVAYGFAFPMPVLSCFVLIIISVFVNFFMMLYPTSTRLNPYAGFVILSFDALQLFCLLYLTGGLYNPFAMLIIVPAVISASSLPWRFTVVLFTLSMIGITLLSLYHLPLPWVAGAYLAIPPILKAGFYTAILATGAFTVLYAHRVAREARELSDALSATELALQREQHLSALDGLAAAAAHELGTPLATITLVARELQLAFKQQSAYSDDLDLIVSQAKRCRDILQRLTSLSADGEEHLSHMPFTSLIEEVIAPHREFDITIHTQKGACIGNEPIGKRNAGIIHGLGNLIENAVDFAQSKVSIKWYWNVKKVGLQIIDDGPGFSSDTLDHIGEPYHSRRVADKRESGGGLGLGLFIAKTLLERSGATLEFTNRIDKTNGAVITINWPRSTMDLEPKKTDIYQEK